MPTRLLTDEGSFSGDSRRKINAMFAELYLYAASGEGGSMPTEPTFETITVAQDTVSIGGHAVQVTGPTVLPPPPVPAEVARIDAPQTFVPVQTFTEPIVVEADSISVGGHDVSVTGPATLPQPLDPNVALKNVDNAFTVPQTFAGVAITPASLSVGGHAITVAGPATIGAVGPVGVTAGPFTAITSITVVNGIVTAITGT